MKRIGGWLVMVVVGLGILAGVDLPVYGQAGGGRRRPPATEPARPEAERPAASASTTPAAPEPLRTAIDHRFDIRDIRLDLHVDLAHKTVNGGATLEIQSRRPIKSIELDAVDFEISKVTLANGTQEPVTPRTSYDRKKLVVYLEPGWPANHKGTLHIDYRLVEPKDGLHFFAPSKSDPKVPLSVWSQGEPSSNRYWIPCVDHPDQRQTTQLVVTVPEGFEVLSNGKLVERKENASDKTVTFDWRQDKPHPAYLVTMVVGQFEVVREEWDGIPVTYYVPKDRKDEVGPTFGKTKEMLTYFSQRFGIHYPWDKYAQVVAHQFGGGMENTSATTMGDILVDQRTLLDSSADSIVSHELAHQWWGDMVTCRDWSHLWLNEGFASYAEALWDEHAKGPDAYAYNMFRKAEGAISGGKSRPVVDRHYPNPGSMFDGRSYPKGAWLLHMLRKQIGDEAFWKSIERYGTTHRFQSAETTDFRRTVERETGLDLERFFYDWAERPGSPTLDITTEYLPTQQQAKVVIKQTQAGEAFHFPLSIVFHSTSSSKPVVIDNEMTEKEATVLVPLPTPPSLIDVDPDQAVLAEIKETKGRDLWAAQVTQAPTVSSRLRAVRHFADSKTEEDRQLLAKALESEPFWGVQVEIAQALGKSGGDTSRKALLKGTHHAEARVRRACVDALSKFDTDAEILAAAKEILHKGDPSYAVEGAAMAVYAKQSPKDAIAVLTPWLSKPSHNDTLRGSALTALATVPDLSVLDTLMTWAQPGKPRNARGSALRGMVLLLQKANPNEKQRQEIWKVLNAALAEDSGRSRFMIMGSLGDLGEKAAPALPALDKMSQNEANERMRDFAKRTADQIRAKIKNAPAATASNDVGQLRKEVEELKREIQELRKQRTDPAKTEQPKR
jgi:aminopeptidase N